MAANMVIVSKKAKKQQERFANNGYVLVDVTSKSEDSTFRKFSPFYPHGNLAVPGSDEVSMSVEGIWQGLKVFENEPMDASKFKVKTMKNLKRPVSEKRGKIVGHQFGDKLIGYKTARREIYEVVYNNMLDTYLKNEMALLIGLLAENQRIAFIDYDTNDDIENTAKPLSHASLIIKKLHSFQM